VRWRTCYEECNLRPDHTVTAPPVKRGSLTLQKPAAPPGLRSRKRQEGKRAKLTLPDPSDRIDGYSTGKRRFVGCPRACEGPFETLAG